MTRFRIKTQKEPSGRFSAHLYLDNPKGSDHYTGLCEFADSKWEALNAIKRVAEGYNQDEYEPEWYEFETEVPEPQSLRAV